MATERAWVVCDECGPLDIWTSEELDSKYEDHVMEVHAPNVSFKWLDETQPTTEETR